MAETTQTTQLKRTLGPIMLWGLGVGYVISGMYFGWNLGLEQGGTLGLAIASIFIIIMYVTFTFGYTELACSIPKAGGAFEYADRALGTNLGFVAGMAQNIEFVFAPPAIAFAIGAYFSEYVPAGTFDSWAQSLGGISFISGAFESQEALREFMPQLFILFVAVMAYFVFTTLNILGVEAAAKFELMITIVAVIGLLIFAAACLPHVSFENMSANSLPNGMGGAFAAVPFAIWFFLAIEGVANVAEETVNPQKNIVIGFGSAILTLVILCIITFICATGVAGWEAAVFPNGVGGDASDAPLPMVLATFTSKSSLLYTALVTIGLFGLVASFHGIILAAGRASFEFGRKGYFPKRLGKVHSKFQTPAFALICNMGVGIIALMTGKTGEIITIACFGALTLYMLSMVSLIALRKKEPNLERPFKVPLYPIFPYTALIISSIAMIAAIVYNLKLALVFGAIMLLSFIYFKLFVKTDAQTK